MILSYETGLAKLKNIIMKRFNFDFYNCNEELLDSNLFGKKIGFEPTHLLYLLNDIENEFNIKIPEDEIVSGKFNTVNNIIQIISRQMELQND